MVKGERATYVKLLWRFAQGCVVLLDKVPANFVLGEIAVGGGTRIGASISSLFAVFVLLLLDEVTVRSHVCCVLVEMWEERLDCRAVKSIVGCRRMLNVD